MSFYVNDPVEIKPVKVTSHSVVELDTSIEWVAQRQWAEGELCHRPSTLRVYRRLVAGKDDVLPEDSPKIWQNLRACNKYAAWDYYESTPTAQKDGQPLHIVFAPGMRVDTLGLYGLIGYSATVTVRVGGDVLEGWPQKVSLQRRDVKGWYDWFTAPFRQREAIVFNNLPPMSGAEIEIVIEPLSGVASVQYILPARGEYIGDLHWEPNISGSNFSRIEREFDGGLRPNVSLVRRRLVPTFSGKFRVPARNVDRVRGIRDRYNAKPVLWVGLSDTPDSPYYEGLLMYGIYRRLEVSPSTPHWANGSIEIEEL